MAPRHGSSSSTGTRLVAVFFLLAMIGLGLSLSTLQTRRSERAISLAREEANVLTTQATVKLGALQKTADEALAARTAAEVSRDTLQKELTALKGRAAQLAAEHAQTVKEAAAKAAEAAQFARLHTATVQAAKDVEGARDKLRMELITLKTRMGGSGTSSDVAVAPEDGRHTPLLPSKERDTLEPDLAAFLKKVAINNEVLATMSNINYARPGGMLDTWIEGIKRSGVKNAIVIALDPETKLNAERQGVPSFQMDVPISKSQIGGGSNHAVSSLKFRVLRHFLQLGYSVFLSDVDIVTLQNPFPYLVRDSDVEGMSDGFDNATAYGYNDVLDDASMGWARYAHSMRVFVFNSGLFYMRPTPAALDLLDRLVQRVETENGWDQAIFNEVIYFPSKPGYTDPHVNRRVLDYLLFMNSKVLFKTVRKDAQRYGKHLPVMIHVNYHPDKHARMKAIVERYVNGNLKALDPFPDGSE